MNISRFRRQDYWLPLAKDTLNGTKRRESPEKQLRKHTNQTDVNEVSVQRVFGNGSDAKADEFKPRKYKKKCLKQCNTWYSKQSSYDRVHIFADIHTPPHKYGFGTRIGSSSTMLILNSILRAKAPRIPFPFLS